MKRTKVNELEKNVGSKVTVKGHAYIIRIVGNISFIILREYTGFCQIVCESELVGHLTPESVVEVTGMVRMNKESRYNGIEVAAEEITVISLAEVLPFTINKKEEVPFLILNNHRALSLRRIRERNIFKIQSEIVWAYREFMRSQGFTEIQSTKISGSGLEGGGDLFEVNYFGNKLCLTQSPQFYKQMMVGVYERVFEVGKVYRAESHGSNRHLAEFVGFDFEMGFIENVEELMIMEQEALKYIFNHLNSVCASELAFFKVQAPIITTIPMLTYEEALRNTGKKFNRVGLNPEMEALISKYVKKTYNSEFTFITKYPLSERPFYAMPSKEEGCSETFELLYNGLEITTGGQRIHNYKMLLEVMESKGMKPENYKSYLAAFRYGMPPHGGLGIGLERIIMKLLNLQSAEEASLIPRTREKFIN